MDEIRLVLLNRFKNLNSLLLELLLLQLILLSFTELEMGNFSCKLVINFFVLRSIAVAGAELKEIWRGMGVWRYIFIAT